MQVAQLSDRGTTSCRVCRSTNLHSVLDLGSHPLPAEYGLSSEDIMDEFPLHLRICSDCGLGQVGEYVFPDRIFHEKYPYLSSASSSWLQHAEEYAINVIRSSSLSSSSLVLEIASNDGYLLSNFASRGVPVLGIEPASNVAKIANDRGIKTLHEFFGVDCANKLLAENIHPDLIVANNVFAHVPNMHDFMQGVSLLCGPNTLVSIENPSFVSLLENSYFDTIYHEHYSYLSSHSVKFIAEQYGLNLVRVDSLTTHGGSNRYWLSTSKSIHSSVSEKLREETLKGLFDPEMWRSFKERSVLTIKGLRSWLTEHSTDGSTIAAYGAAHKGNTFLNAAGISSKDIQFIVDASPEKHGKFLPGSQIPVFAPDYLESHPPTDILILPWNISDELSKCITSYVPSARQWIAQPIIKQIN